MPNVFILGSCVSRDTRPFLGNDWTMIKYVARQGFISAASGPAHLKGQIKLASAFQMRCLNDDLNGNALETLELTAPETDLVLIDLIDERLGVYETEDGAYVTHTWELEESGLLAQQLKPLRHVPFSSDEHFDLWTTAAEFIVHKVRSLNLALIALAPDWAAKADNGGGGFDYRGIPAATWNERYSRYYEKLESLGVEIVRPPASNSIAATKHQWGLAPYHFVNRMYEYMQRSIKDYYQRSQIDSEI